MKYVPGPGTYTPKLFLGENSVTSNYKQGNQRSFYHHDRYPNNKNKGNFLILIYTLEMPGPG